MLNSRIKRIFVSVVSCLSMVFHETHSIETGGTCPTLTMPYHWNRRNMATRVQVKRLQHTYKLLPLFRRMLRNMETSCRTNMRFIYPISVERTCVPNLLLRWTKTYLSRRSHGQKTRYLMWKSVSANVFHSVNGVVNSRIWSRRPPGKPKNFGRFNYAHIMTGKWENASNRQTTSTNRHIRKLHMTTWFWWSMVWITPKRLYLTLLEPRRTWTLQKGWRLTSPVCTSQVGENDHLHVTPGMTVFPREVTPWLRWSLRLYVTMPRLTTTNYLQNYFFIWITVGVKTRTVLYLGLPTCWFIWGASNEWISAFYQWDTHTTLSIRCSVDLLLLCKIRTSSPSRIFIEFVRKVILHPHVPVENDSSWKRTILVRALVLVHLYLCTSNTLTRWLVGNRFYSNTWQSRSLAFRNRDTFEYNVTRTVWSDIDIGLNYRLQRQRNKLNWTCILESPWQQHGYHSPLTREQNWHALKLWSNTPLFYFQSCVVSRVHFNHTPCLTWSCILFVHIQTSRHLMKSTLHYRNYVLFVSTDTRENMLNGHVCFKTTNILICLF